MDWSVGGVVQEGNWTGLVSYLVVDLKREDVNVVCSIIPIDGLQSYSAEHSISFIGKLN